MMDETKALVEGLAEMPRMVEWLVRRLVLVFSFCQMPGGPTRTAIPMDSSEVHGSAGVSSARLE